MMIFFLMMIFFQSSSILPLPSPSTSSDTLPPFSDLILLQFGYGFAALLIWWVTHFLLRFQGQGDRKSGFITPIRHRGARSSNDVVVFFAFWSQLIRRCRLCSVSADVDTT